MAPYHILIVIISSVIPENLPLLTKSEQSGPKSAHIRHLHDPGAISRLNEFNMMHLLSYIMCYGLYNLTTFFVSPLR